MIKVTHLIPSLSRGGAERLLVALATEQTAHASHEVSVVTITGRWEMAQRLTEQGVTVRSLLPRTRRPAALAETCRAVHDLRSADVVHAWMYHCIVLARGLTSSARVVAAVHHDDPADPGLRPRTRVVARTALRRARRLGAVTYVGDSSRAKHASIARGAAASVIPGGLDPRQFAPAADRFGLSTMGLPQGARVVVHVARRHPDKDQETLLRGFAQVRTPDAHLVLVGRGLDRSCVALVDLAAELGITDRVHLIGEVDDPAVLLSQADVFCLSSRTESLPVSLLEAIATGLLPVVTDVGDCGRVVDGVGHVVRPGDARALGAALSAAVEEAPTRDVSAIQSAVREHTTDAMRRGYDAVYEYVGAGSAQSRERGAR